MSRYRIDYAPAAEKQLRAIRDARVATPIRRAIEKLADNPRPPGCLKLVGEVNQWRIRVGDWRVVYVIEDGRLVVVLRELRSTLTCARLLQIGNDFLHS